MASTVTTFFATVLATISWLTDEWSPVEAHLSVPAMYVFGDSTADVGNNNYLPGDKYSLDKANYPHNGVDFPSGEPTGRFCNGYVGVDFMAMRLGFEKSPPAALSVQTAAVEYRGVNYASGGSGILDQTGVNVSLSMNTQIDLFRSTVRRLEATKGRRTAHYLLSKSILVFSTANNDIFAFFSQLAAGNNSTSPDLFTSSLAAQFAEQIETLYGIGARKMAVFGTGRLGCPPAMRRFSPTGACQEDLNNLSRKFNAAMKEQMKSLRSKLRELKYSFVNSYEIGSEISKKTLQFGFKEVKSACCGKGVFNAESLCTPDVSYCSNRDEYLNWDWVHPTQANYKKFIDLAYAARPRFVDPISLHQLPRY